jgi:uncharacterized protein
MFVDCSFWEAAFEQFLVAQLAEADGAHDLAHVERVVTAAKKLAQAEGADLAVVIPAAWLHDCVTVAKDSPERHLASRLAADTAVSHLSQLNYPAQHYEAIHHAIAAHSFTAQITPETLEAKVVQDADRLDAIGAIGIARCLIVGGELKRPLYHPHEPLPHTRQADDRLYTIDHFYTKLFKLVGTMQTAAGRTEAEHRTEFMKIYLQQLESEITPSQ